MDASLVVVVSLSGAALVVSSSNPMLIMSEWFRGFVHPFNPLLWVGHALNCTLFVGFLTGVVWSLQVEGNPFLMGGAVSLVSYALEQAFTLIESIVRLLVRAPTRQQHPSVIANELASRRQEQRKDSLRKIRERSEEGSPLSEEEAHAMVDDEQ